MSFHCSTCSFVTKTSKGLNIHCNKAHGENKNLICPHCYISFTKKYNLERHISTCTEKATPTPSEPAVAPPKGRITNSNTNICNTTNNTQQVNFNFFCNDTGYIEKLVPITNDLLRKASQSIFQNQSITSPKQMAQSLYETCLKPCVISTDSSRGTVEWHDGDDKNKKIKDKKAKILTNKTLAATKNVVLEAAHKIKEQIGNLNAKSITYGDDFDRLLDRQRYAVTHLKGNPGWKDEFSLTLSKEPPCDLKYATQVPTKVIDDKVMSLGDFKDLLKQWIKQNMHLLFFNRPRDIGTKLKSDLGIQTDEEKEVIFAIDDSGNPCPLSLVNINKLFYESSREEIEYMSTFDNLRLMLTRPASNVEEVFENERNFYIYLLRQDTAKYFATELFKGFFTEE